MFRNLKKFPGREDGHICIFPGRNFISLIGGSTLFIETATKKVLRGRSEKEKGTGSLDVTGQLGDVMKESCHIAYTFAKVRVIDNVFRLIVLVY